MIHIVGVEPADPFKLLLEFNTGERKLVDIEQYLHGPIFRPVRDDSGYFNQVKVDDELGTIVWSKAQISDECLARVRFACTSGNRASAKCPLA